MITGLSIRGSLFGVMPEQPLRSVRRQRARLAGQKDAGMLFLDRIEMELGIMSCSFVDVVVSVALEPVVEGREEEEGEGG